MLMAVVATVATAFYVMEDKMNTLAKDSMYSTWFGNTYKGIELKNEELDEAIAEIERDEADCE